MADRDRKDKGNQFLDLKTALNESLSKKDKDSVKLNKSIQTLLTTNTDMLSQINSGISSIDKSLMFQKKILLDTGKNMKDTKKALKSSSEEKSFARKKDPNLKVIQELNDLEDLMKENNKLQKSKKSGSGLLGLLGLAGGLLGIGGLLGFLFTGKKEYLYSTIKGFVKGFGSLFAPAGKLLGSIGKMLGLDKLVGGLGKSLGKLIGDMFKPAGDLIGTIAKAIGFGGVKTGGKTGGKVLGKIGSKMLKQIPGIGLIMGIMFGISRFKSGDVLGGIGEIASGAATLLNAIAPGAGTAVSLAIDGVLLLRDIVGTEKFDEGAGNMVGKVGKMGFDAIKSIAGIGPIAWLLEGIKLFSSGKTMEGLEFIASGIMGIVPKTGELIGNIIGWIKSADIGGAAKTTWDTITNIVTNPWDAIKNNPFMKGITKGFVGAADATQSVAGSALDYTYNKVIGPSNLKGGETTGTVTGATPNITGMQDVQEMIKKNEGFRENAYKDASGKSIGYGHFIKKGENLTKITLDQAEKLFEGDFKTAVDNAQNIPGFSSLNKKGQAALIDMTYNMGVNWWKGNAKTGKGRWNNLIKGLESKDYELVEKSIKDSNYYKQVPKSRTSTNISNILSNSSRNGGYNLSSNQMQQKINIEGSSLELSNSTIEKLADKITEGYKNSMPKKTGTTVSVQPVGRG